MNGLRAVVISTAILRADMLRKGRTYELLIKHHFLNSVADGHRPQLGTGILFRGIHGRVELELSGKDKAQAGTVVPTFYSLAGEMITIPERFLPLVRAATKGVELRWLHSRALPSKAASYSPAAIEDPVHQNVACSETTTAALVG